MLNERVPLTIAYQTPLNKKKLKRGICHTIANPTYPQLQ